jgi:hypothetical protein
MQILPRIRKLPAAIGGSHPPSRFSSPSNEKAHLNTRDYPRDIKNVAHSPLIPL